MSKEQTPIEKFISLKLNTSDITLALELKKFVEQNYLSKEEAQAKVLEAQNNLIADIKNKVAKLEENVNTTDFAFDVINLLKSIKPLSNE